MSFCTHVGLGIIYTFMYGHDDEIVHKCETEVEEENTTFDVTRWWPSHQSNYFYELGCTLRLKTQDSKVFIRPMMFTISI